MTRLTALMSIRRKGQLHAQGRDDRMGGLLRCAIAERDVRPPGFLVASRPAAGGTCGSQGCCPERSEAMCWRHGEHDRLGVVKDLARADRDRRHVGQVVRRDSGHVLHLLVGELLGWPGDVSGHMQPSGWRHVQAGRRGQALACLAGEISDLGVVAHDERGLRRGYGKRVLTGTQRARGRGRAS